MKKYSNNVENYVVHSKGVEKFCEIRYDQCTKSMKNIGKEKMFMEKQKKNIVAKWIKNALDVVLHTEANTVSCVILYQPKAPNGLIKFRRNK